MFRELYIFIEGDDDERFIESVVKPILNNRYDYIGYYKYAKRPKSKVERYIQNIASRNIDFFCLVDIDLSPCVTFKKQLIKTDKFGKIDDSKIMVVKKAIESWYLAGLNTDYCRKLRISETSSTDDISKQKFEQILSNSKLGCTLNCMKEILKHYDLVIARSKNSSFDYFHRHLLD